MFEIEWDPAKAASNRRKHRVSFELAATVFRDPLARSIPDDDRDAFEERWITIGQARGARLLVVSHTDVRNEDDKMSVRIVSARLATPDERRRYEVGK